jgi:hypothetical protein
MEPSDQAAGAAPEEEATHDQGNRDRDGAVVDACGSGEAGGMTLILIGTLSKDKSWPLCNSFLRLVGDVEQFSPSTTRFCVPTLAPVFRSDDSTGCCDGWFLGRQRRVR